MTRTMRLLSLAIVAGALAAAFAAPSAFAAAAKAQPFATAPKPRLTVQLWPAENVGSVLIVSATLPSSTPLPATVDLPFPNGASSMWVGEIMGGAGPEADVEQSATIVPVTGGRVLRVVFKTSREIQYEASWLPPTVNGTRASSTLEWVQTAGASEVDFGVKLPSTASDVKIDPAPQGAPEVNEAGEQLWTLPPATLALGQTRTVKVDYTLSAGGAAAPSSGSDALLYVLVGLLVVAVIGLAVAVRVQMSRARS